MPMLPRVSPSQSLYGHYLLPNGKLAHFVLGDMVRKGHKVDLPQPPIQPFTPADWLPAPASGLPLTDVFGRDWGWVGGRGVAAGVTGPLWCPVPVLGPKPSQTVLEWEEGSFGPEGGVLALRRWGVRGLSWRCLVHVSWGFRVERWACLGCIVVICFALVTHSPLC